MNTMFAMVAAGLYFLAAFILMGRFVHKEGPNQRLGYVLAVIAVLAHAIFLSGAIMQVPGQNMSITNVLSLVAWLITISMLLSARVLPNTILLPVVYGFAGLTVLASLFIPVAYIMQIQLEPGLIIHITLSLIAYGLLAIAFLYALQMSFITHKLKQKGASLLHSSLPPLMLVEGILFKLLLAGTLFLVVSLISGFVFLDDMFSRTAAHKTVLSLIALLVYVFLLAGQRVWGWRGKQVIALTTTGLVLLSLAYFGSRVVREWLL
ncbi:cytochrome c biogenesis protein CcsA [Alteromonas sp. ASW11-19]|uniref:Cytochrome c biogenesis protein CcsA n=1 Tax=Alteromonas salexigens TaxID=2982530 RepID=A0ABT2VPD6_9ALTE|nr:cytochrome c biogenesis protein CcsA [Alteromonas salexigens]MCU7555181.1 cytochrome c biogenesis protein CcsA [Alteromonas salexigens]